MRKSLETLKSLLRSKGAVFTDSTFVLHGYELTLFMWRGDFILSDENENLFVGTDVKLLIDKIIETVWRD